VSPLIPAGHLLPGGEKVIPHQATVTGTSVEVRMAWL
jgi:hypothetical protein